MPSLRERILNTLRFFDLQDIPLTLLELHKFLLDEKQQLQFKINTDWEIVNEKVGERVSVSQVLECLDTECKNEVESRYGYYALKDRGEIIQARWKNYLYGFKRERRIKRYAWMLKHIPFVRGVAIGGSQALGQQRQGSDIDLLIFTEYGFMWLARTLVSIYFQLFGIRRHGEQVANRFCLNHYLAQPKSVDREKNAYKAMEYGRLRPLAYPQTVSVFLQQNQQWIRSFFPNLDFSHMRSQAQSTFQKLGEWFLNNAFGKWLEKMLKRMELPRIVQDDYTFVLEDELSFHPGSRHTELLAKFFQNL